MLSLTYGRSEDVAQLHHKARAHDEQRIEAPRQLFRIKGEIISCQQYAAIGKYKQQFVILISEIKKNGSSHCRNCKGEYDRQGIFQFISAAYPRYDKTCRKAVEQEHYHDSC
jgi:hypothetical protein